MFGHFRPERVKQVLQRLESALGHKQTFGGSKRMSGLPPKADIRRSDQTSASCSTGITGLRHSARAKHLSQRLVRAGDVGHFTFSILHVQRAAPRRHVAGTACRDPDGKFSLAGEGGSHRKMRAG
jgi:hypothetical protein